MVEADGGLKMPSDWVKTTAQRIKQVERDKQISDTKAVQDHSLLKAGASKKWEEVRTYLKQNVQDFNAEMAREFLIWESPHSKEAVIRVKDRDRVLTCTYDEGTFSIGTQGVRMEAKFQAEVLNGKIVFRNAAAYVVSEQSAAEEILGCLVTDLDA
jgi:hypothetical protein